MFPLSVDASAESRRFCQTIISTTWSSRLPFRMVNPNQTEWWCAERLRISTQSASVRTDSTLKTDRGTKLRSYARAGIVCYWIINLIDRQIEVYTQPDSMAAEPTYRHREVIAADGTVDLVIDDKPVAKLAAADLLPTLPDR
jgi:hypothetical protein